MDVKNVTLGIIRTARPVRNSSRDDGPVRTFGLAHNHWRKDWTDLVFRNQLHGFGPQLRCEVNQIINRRNTRDTIGRRLGRKRLRWGVPLTRYIAFWDRPFFDGPDRLTG